jgi:hypothetical protein
MRAVRVSRRIAAAMALFALGVMTARAQRTPGAENGTKAIDVLVAENEIRQQIYNYSRGLDRMDKALALQVWHPDGTADYGGAVTKGSEFVERAFKLHESYISHTHHMIDSIIRVNGDTAVSETYANTSMLQEIEQQASQGVVTRAKGISVSLIRGRYADKWSKRNGRWALDHRKYIEDFRTVQELPTQARIGAGKRDRTDPSYAVYPY